MTKEVSPNNSLSEILTKLGTAPRIMSFYGDYFETFIVLNSLSKRVKERFIYNKKWYLNVHYKDERRYWKITRFDKQVIDTLLFNHLYEKLFLDIYIEERYLNSFQMFLDAIPNPEKLHFKNWKIILDNMDLGLAGKIWKAMVSLNIQIEFLQFNEMPFYFEDKYRKIEFYREKYFEESCYTLLRKKLNQQSMKNWTEIPHFDAPTIKRIEVRNENENDQLLYLNGCDITKDIKNELKELRIESNIQDITQMNEFLRENTRNLSSRHRRVRITNNSDLAMPIEIIHSNINWEIYQSKTAEYDLKIKDADLYYVIDGLMGAIRVEELYLNYAFLKLENKSNTDNTPDFIRLKLDNYWGFLIKNATDIPDKELDLKSLFLGNGIQRNELVFKNKNIRKILINSTNVLEYKIGLNLDRWEEIFIDLKLEEYDFEKIAEILTFKTPTTANITLELIIFFRRGEKDFSRIVKLLNGISLLRVNILKVTAYGQRNFKKAWEEDKEGLEAFISLLWGYKTLHSFSLVFETPELEPFQFGMHSYSFRNLKEKFREFLKNVEENKLVNMKNYRLPYRTKGCYHYQHI